jgi:hypothetical protein
VGIFKASAPLPGVPPGIYLEAETGAALMSEQKLPPRVWVSKGAFDVEDFAECSLHYSGEAHEGETEYLSLAEHETILGQRLNYGYEWSTEEIKKMEQTIARFKRDVGYAIAELKSGRLNRSEIANLLELALRSIKEPDGR